MGGGIPERSGAVWGVAGRSCCFALIQGGAAPPYRERRDLRRLGSAALPRGVGRSCRSAQIFFPSPMYLMHPAPERPVFRTRNQTFSDGVLPRVLPLLSIILIVPQPMVKAAGLKPATLQMRLGKKVFPKCHPPFNSELQFARRAEQMQMIRHKDIIAHQPGCGLIFPNLMQRPLHTRLRQPRRPLFSADGKENPIRAAQHNMDPLAGARRPGSRSGASDIGRIYS